MLDSIIRLNLGNSTENPDSNNLSRDSHPTLQIDKHMHQANKLLHAVCY